MTTTPPTRPTYTDYKRAHLKRRGVACGDTLEVRLSSLFGFEPRLIHQAFLRFVDAYGIVPQRLLMHPSALGEPPPASGGSSLDILYLRDEKDLLDVLGPRSLDSLQQQQQQQPAGAGFIAMGFSASGQLGVLDPEGLPSSVEVMFDETFPTNTIAVSYTEPLCEICTLKARLMTPGHTAAQYAAMLGEIEEALTRGSVAATHPDESGDGGDGEQEA
jgi:hypothetical protein